MARNKKEKNNEKVVIATMNDEIQKLTKLIIGVLVIFILFFSITYLLTKREKEDQNPTNEETKIQYNEILVGELLNQHEDEYYVLVTKKEDHFVGLYQAYLSEYKNKEKALRVYYSNLSNIFNEKYQANESQFSITDIKDIRFMGTTLIKVKGKKIVSYYEGKEKIVEHLTTIIE